MDDHSRGASTGTDAGGRFELKGIDPGRYRLKVVRTGFVTQEYGQKTPNDPGAVLTLSAGLSMRDLLFSADTLGSHRGPRHQRRRRTTSLEPSERFAGDLHAREKNSVHGNDGADERSGRVSSLWAFGRAGTSSPPSTGQVNTSSEKKAWHRLKMTAARKGTCRPFTPAARIPRRPVALAIKAGEEIPSVEILLRPVEVFKIQGRVLQLCFRDARGTQRVCPLSRAVVACGPVFPARQALVDKPDRLLYDCGCSCRVLTPSLLTASRTAGLSSASKH